MAEIAIQDNVAGTSAAQQLSGVTLPARLQSQECSQLNKLASSDASSKLLELALDRLIAVAQYDADFNDGDKVPDCERALKSLIDAQHDTRALQQAGCRAVDYTDVQQTAQLNDYIKERLEVAKTTYRDRDERSRYMKNQTFASFKTVIWSAEHGDIEAPPMSTFFQHSGEENATDDELEMTLHGTRSLNCPLTLSRLVEPVKSERCPHTFSRVAILQLLNGRQKACPVAGCPQQLYPQDLVRDRVMERLLQQDADRDSDDEINDHRATARDGDEGSDTDMLVI